MKNNQESTTELKNGEVMTSLDIDMEFVYIEPGSFMMGGDEYDFERPIHEVSFSKGYWLGKYPVTQGEYNKIIGEEPSHFQKGLKLTKGILGFRGKSLKDDTSKYPVESVSWNDAIRFCTMLNNLERSAGRLPDGYEYRLPSESEWEFAVRGGINKSKAKYSGGDNINDVAWYKENSEDRTHPVGELAPNEIGLHDMCGNVWEWCLDDWHSGYEGCPVDGSHRGEGKGASRVFRGGGWSSIAEYCRSSNRYYLAPGFIYNFLGFRVALAPCLKKK